MLCELYIENLAVIEKTDIKFDIGLSVFTGETGAGKSIVIDAINAVLGQRTLKEIVRHNAKKAVISATFRDISKSALAKLTEFGYDGDYLENNELLITREISADAKSSARIMGRPVTIGILKEIGTELINIHGQHDNQVLLSPEKHIDILDKYGDFTALLDEYYNCYKSVVLIKRSIKKLTVNEQDKAEKINLLTYQIDEIMNAHLKPDEDLKLEAKQLQIKNQVRIINGLNVVYTALTGQDDEGAVEICKSAARTMEDISSYYEPSSDFSDRLEGLGVELEELALEISNHIDSFEVYDSSLETIGDRLDEIHKLKRKYGDTTEKIQEFMENAQNELDNLELSDKRLVELNHEGTKEYERLLALAEQITEQRLKAGERFVKSITGELAFLDMPNVSLQVKREHTKPNLKGQDGIEFLISTNRGEPPKSIAKIASGGELSRIMLAIKNTLADKDEIQTLIFDEIDTGVSGHAAQKIGLKLSEAATNRQIIAVTHLAQIAALANHHYLIKKESDENNTYTHVTKLDLEGRVQEVARIMSTDKISDLMLKSAREMIVGRK